MMRPACSTPRLRSRRLSPSVPGSVNRPDWPRSWGGSFRRPHVRPSLMPMRLNALASSPGPLAAQNASESTYCHPILTPHPGEFARLSNTDTPTVQKNSRNARRQIRSRASARARAEGAQNGDHRRPPRGDQFHWQQRHGNRRNGRRTHRADYGSLAQGMSPSRRPNSASICTGWRATWRPARSRKPGFDRFRLATLAGRGVAKAGKVTPLARALTAW